MSDSDRKPPTREPTAPDPPNGPAEESTDSLTTPAAHRRQRLKFLIFSLIPVLTLLTLAEGLLRLTGTDRPFLTNFQSELDYPDEDLFWSLPPGARIESMGTLVVTNSLGLRSPEPKDKQPDEFRILSLGESTTFGALVENDQTYSALLEVALNQNNTARTFRVINAGVSGYTSFQSLKYLELRGLELKPDLVLLYHEVNDYLPAWHARITSEAVTDLALSDRQLYESRQRKLHRKLLSWSAIYRALHSLKTRQQIEEYESSHQGLPDHLEPVELVLGLRDASGRKLDLPGYYQQADLPIRVPSGRTAEVLHEFAAVCDEHDITLVVIHPSYNGVPPHECVLTTFCEEADVPLFEASDALLPLEPHIVYVDESGNTWSEHPLLRRRRAPQRRRTPTAGGAVRRVSDRREPRAVTAMML